MGAAGGVRTRGAARGWSGTVETVLGECWDGLGARSIEQQGRVGLGRAGPGRSVPGGGCRRTWLGAGRSGRDAAGLSPSRPRARCAAARPHRRLWAGAAGKGKEREGRAVRSLPEERPRLRVSRMEKKNKIKSVFCLQLLTTAPSGFSTPGAFLPFYVAGFCKPSPCPGTSAARRCPHAESRWSSLSAF